MLFFNFYHKIKINGHLRSNPWTRCPSPLAMFLPSFVRINILNLGKIAKLWFQTLKMATITRGQGCLKSNLWARCPLPIAMSLPRLVRITKKDWEKSAKNVISDPKNGCDFPRSESFEVKFTDMVSLINGNVLTKFRSYNHNRFGEKCKNVISDPRNGRHFERSR